MSAKKIDVFIEGFIKRPPAEVRQQYADIEYHRRFKVHPKIHFTVLEKTHKGLRFKQEVNILGLRQSDLARNEFLENGELSTEIVEGTNQGMRIHYQFLAQGNGTLLKAHFQIPLKGLKAMMAPFFKWAVHKTAMRAFWQDKRDLESGSYSRYLEDGKKAKP